MSQYSHTHRQGGCAIDLVVEHQLATKEVTRLRRQHTRLKAKCSARDDYGGCWTPEDCFCSHCAAASSQLSALLAAEDRLEAVHREMRALAAEIQEANRA